MAKFAMAGNRVFWTQVHALTKKNFLLYRRRWLATIISAYILPLLIVLLVLNIPNLQSRNNRRGIGTPAPVLDLATVLPVDKELIIVTNNTLGADVQAAVDALTRPLVDKRKFSVLSTPQELADRCAAQRGRSSPCHAAIQFDDSPQTSGGTGRWVYTLRLASEGDGDPWNTNNPAQQTFLPISLALHKAITNATDLKLETYFFTHGTQSEADAAAELQGLKEMLQGFAWALFFSFIPILYMTATFVARERNEGLSQLVDSMGGNAVSRVLASLIAADLIHFPTFLISGCLCWHYGFKNSNAAIPIFWWIFSGMALIHSTVFIAALFRRGYVAGIVAVTIHLLVLLPRLVSYPELKVAEGIILGLLFPSTNWYLFLSNITYPAVRRWPVSLVSMLHTPPASPDHLPAIIFFCYSILHLLAFPLLAILVERLLHGISFKGRTFSDSPESQASFSAIQSTGLKKVYHPSIWRKIFCCACGKRSKPLVAVDGVSLNAQKRQIMALLGLNGSGKTTTMDLITGFQACNEGTVQINAPATQLGICPQKNVLYSELTVLEHVRFWSDLKGGKETTEELYALIEACDLAPKTNRRAGSLSGGQKRKLQLACMFVGGSSVCLMDEVTTGLDPVSRRSIWNIILAERSRRSMIFSTHFLDEGEVLADHIVLLSKGRIKAQGTSAELKSRYGGGYSVHIPRPTDGRDPMTLGVPSMIHQDRVLYTANDSAEAGRLIAQLEAAGKTGIDMEGPTVENVFLKLADDANDPDNTDTEDRASTLASGRTRAALSLVPGSSISTFGQVKVLFMKRLKVLPRFWLAPLLALALPVALPPSIGETLQGKPPFVPAYIRPDCPKFNNQLTSAYSVTWQGYAGRFNEQPNVFGPVGDNSPWNKTLWDVVKGGSPPISPYMQNNTRNSEYIFAYARDYAGFVKGVENGVKYKDTRLQLGMYMGDESHPHTLALQTSGYSYKQSFYLWAGIQSQVKFTARSGSFTQMELSRGREAGIWIWIAAAFMSVCPALFALYPSFERANKIRALQYANGVRPLPLWLSHLLFESITVVLISIALTITVAVQLGPTMWFAPGYMFIIGILYNMAALLIAFIMSRLARTQAGAFLYAMFTLLAMFLVAGVAGGIAPDLVGLDERQRLSDILYWTLGLVIPQVHLWRSFSFGLNSFRVGCRDGEMITYPGSIHAYGGPILMLLIQVISLTTLLVWLESSNSFSAASDLIASYRRRGKVQNSIEAAAAPGTHHKEAITTETARVDASAATADGDLLRMSHVTKAFGKHVAVDDVSLGLGGSEILALLGPNGAGKTTIANMIMGELRPDSGHIHLKGTDVHRDTRLAQRSLGVCPQFDALDLMTMRQHLEFYAGVRGISRADMNHNINVIVEALGIGPHMNKAASKLSGGNKRKLSLAIAIIGSPDVLILDEPSSAMDALAKRRLWVLLESVAPGRSVLLTTHSMEEADALATRVSIISKRLLAIGTTQNLREHYSNLYYVTLILKTAPESLPGEMAAVETWIRQNLPGATFQDVSLGGQVKFLIPNAASSAHSSSSSVAAPAPASGDAATTPGTAPATASTPSAVSIGKLIELLEAHKEVLGIQDYSIGSPTLERVFLSVIKENDVVEEEETPKKAWWKP